MKRKRYTETQIAFALRQAESGTPVAEIVRKLGISEINFCRWKKKFAGMGVVDKIRISFSASLQIPHKIFQNPPLLSCIAHHFITCEFPSNNIIGETQR